MSAICYEGIVLAKRLVEVHGDHELGAGILASAQQCLSQRDCDYAARCAETITLLTALLAQRAE